MAQNTHYAKKKINTRLLRKERKTFVVEKGKFLVFSQKHRNIIKAVKNPCYLGKIFQMKNSQRMTS